MWEDVALGASRIAVQVAVWPFVAALVVQVVRRPPRWPRALPAVATILLLVGTAVGAVAPDAWLFTGATWWFALPVLLGCYPDGRFVPRWILVPVALYLAFAVAFVVTGGEVAERWGGVVGFSTLILFGASVYRYLRRSGPDERESVRWAILAVLVTAATFIVQMIVEGGTVAEHGPLSLATANLFASVIPVGLALGLLRPRLVDVDRVLAGLVAVLIAGIAMAVAAAGAWAVGGFAAPSAAAVFAIVAVALVALPAVGLARLHTAALPEVDVVLARVQNASDPAGGAGMLRALYWSGSR